MFALLERLILFFVIITTVRSVLQFVFRFFRGSGTSVPFISREKASNAPLSSTLHQDPVCGTYVATDTSLKRIIDGKVVHFCSTECRDRYAA